MVSAYSINECALPVSCRMAPLSFRLDRFPRLDRRPFALAPPPPPPRDKTDVVPFFPSLPVLLRMR